MFEKMNKSMLVAAMILAISTQSHADQGHGKVTFAGAVIDAPCSISPESVDQTVELGQISNLSLKDGGHSTPKYFNIRLENCALGTPATKNKVQVTFSGMGSVAGNGLLGITGNASGASVAITDGAGTPIELGKPTKEQVLQDGNNSLNFAAYMKGDGTAATITEGDFQAVTNFTLAYN